MNIKILSFLAMGFLLNSCQILVTAQPDKLTFAQVKDWGVLGRDAPKELLEQFKIDNQEILRSWTGDPKRFLVYIHKGYRQENLYIVNPRIDCSSFGCPEDTNTYFDYYAPFCYARKRYCAVMFYVEENKKFRVVFGDHFGYQGDGEKGNLFAFSTQVQQGLPICFEVKGTTLAAEDAGKLPPAKEDERFVSRYCYNGDRYTLNKVYTERWDWLIQDRERNRK